MNDENYASSLFVKGLMMNPLIEWLTWHK